MSLVIDNEQKATEGSEPPGCSPSRPRSLLGGGLLSVIDQTVVSGTNFATTILVGRLSSQSELGVYSLALALVLFARSAQVELICAPYLFFCRQRERESLPSYTGNTLVQFLMVTFLSMMCLLGVAAILGLRGDSAGTVGAVLAMTAAAPFLLVREFLRRVSLAHFRLRVVLTMDVAIGITQVGALLLLGSTGSLSVYQACSCMMGACALGCLGWVLSRTEPIQIVRSRMRQDWKQNWDFARWSLAGFLVASSTAVIIPWMVALVHGEAAAGILAACSVLVNCAGMYIDGVLNFLGPRAAEAFAEGGPEELWDTLSRGAWLLLLTVGAFCALLLALGDLPTRLVFGQQYSGTGLILVMIALAVLVGALRLVAGLGLAAMNQPQANFRADLCTVLATIVVMVCLVGPLGVVSAGVAPLVGNSVGAVLRCRSLARLMKQARQERAAALS